jgi:hypothetical protein
MKLENIKNLKSGDILHCTRQSFLSKIIRRSTQSDKVSHTALFILIEGHPFIIDSQWDGTRMRSLEEWNRTYNYDVIITRSNSWNPTSKELIKQIKPYLNKAYGYWDLVKHWVYGKTGWWMKGKREEQFLTCSEFVSRLRNKKDAYKTNPFKLYVWLLEKGDDIIEQNAE